MKVRQCFVSLVAILTLSMLAPGCVKISTNSSDDPWRKVYNIAQKSVVKVVIFETNPVTDKLELVGHGTGTIISSDGLILTAAHVVDLEGTDLYKPVIKVLFSDGTLYETLLVRHSNDHDVGIVKIDLNTKKLKAPLCKDNAAVTEPVMAVGHAWPFTCLFTDGVVSAYQPFDDGLGLSTVDAPWMLMSSPVNPGVSGGPIFSRENCIAGTVSGQFLAHNDVFFAVPVEEVKKEIKKLLSQN